MGDFTNPSWNDFISYYNRDFPYDTTGSGDLSLVQPTDITNALGKSSLFINPSLYPSQSAYNFGFLSLAAHYLVLNLRASSQGIAGGQGEWMVTSKSVGGVSQGITIPQWILDNPSWCQLTTTRYGMDYLQYLLPQLVGVCFSAYGATNP